MVKREELLEVLSKNSDKELVNFILQCKRNGSSCLSDALSSCSKKQLCYIWETTYAIVLDKLHEIIPEDNVEESDKLDLLQTLILMISGMLSQEDVYMCEPMFQTAYLLKDSFQAIPPSKDTMKNSLAKLFEDWWHKNLYGRQHLINSTFIYILDRSVDLRNKEVAAVVKRVWSLHEIIPMIELHAIGNQELRELLKRCFICSQYVKNEQGIKFLAYIISEDGVFTALLHKTIKNHLASAPRSWPEKYGEVYFRAWQILYKSGGEQLLEFEQNCIQDLMSVALQAQATVGAALRKLLGYIHKQKKQRGVEEMLCRLYEPLLWRMLKVPNRKVRENAVVLFFDAFPINNPDQSKEESHQFLQKQFELFTFLLNDPCPDVRSVTIQGIFQVMTDCWELFSEERLKNLMKIFIVDLRLDSSSKTVRSSVIRGFTCLLDNPLSHTFLKTVLPKLQKSFHDVSEIVRVDMVDLLIKVKKIRRIRFWDIIPLEQILSRLAHDEDPVNRRIAELLFSNFIPLDDSVDVQIERSVYLIEKNRPAMREFFKLAAKHMSLNETVDYILTLCKAVLMAVKKKVNKEVSQTEGNSDQSNQDNDMEADKTHDVTPDDGDDDDSKEDEDYFNKLTVDNTPLMLGLLDGIFLLWTMIREQLCQSENADLKKHLDKRLGLAVVQMDNVFKDREIVSVLVRMMGYLPANYVPTINRSWLPKLRSLTNENTEEDFDDLVVSLCEINRTSDVFELALDWIKPSLETQKVASTSGKPSKKNRRVRICDPLKPQPLLGIKLLGFLFKERITNRIILENHMDDILTVRNLLKNSMSRIQEHLHTNSSDRDENKETFSMLAFTLYWKILFFLHSEDEATYNCLPELCEILTWATKHAPLKLAVENERDNAACAQETIEERKDSLAVQITENLLKLLYILFLSGFADEKLCTTAVEFCTEVLINDTELQFLPKILQCLYHDIKYVKFTGDAEITQGLENSLPGALTRLFVSVSTYVQNHEDLSVKVLQGAKTAMFNMMKAIYKNNTFTDSFMDTVMSTIMAMVMAEMGYRNQQLDLEEETELSTLPMLTKWVLEIIQKNTVSVKYFIKSLEDYCSELRSVEHIRGIHGAVHLLGALQKSKCTQKGLKPIWTSLTITVDSLTRTMDTEEADDYKDIVASITKKMNDCQERFTSAVS